MQVERGMGVESAAIVALSIPFALGVAAAAATSKVIGGYGYLAASLCMAAVAGLMVLCCSQGNRRTGIYALYAMLGYLCWLGSALCGTPSAALPQFTGAWLDRLSGLIDETGFSDGRTTALLKALLTGRKGGLEQSTLQAFRVSGASHILALSGLHLGIIYSCIATCLRILGNSRPAAIVRSTVTVTACGLYTLITGAGPSTVRAFLFIIFTEISRLQPGRRRSPLAILCTALMIQLCIAPNVISSVGFQLSYLAMLGIFVIFPSLDGWYPSDAVWDPMKRIWTSIALTVSCQIFTAPVVWIHFHTFPKYFLLTNLLALPVTEALMVSAVLTLTLSALGCCPETAKALVDFLAGALIFCLDVISGM